MNKTNNPGNLTVVGQKRILTPDMDDKRISCNICLKCYFVSKNETVGTHRDSSVYSNGRLAASLYTTTYISYQFSILLNISRTNALRPQSIDEPINSICHMGQLCNVLIRLLSGLNNSLDDLLPIIYNPVIQLDMALISLINPFLGFLYLGVSPRATELRVLGLTLTGGLP